MVVGCIGVAATSVLKIIVFPSIESFLFVVCASVRRFAIYLMFFWEIVDII